MPTSPIAYTPLLCSHLGIRVGRDELPRFDIIDVGTTDLDTSGFFLEKKGDAAIFVAPGGSTLR
jgi:hypothetical protein